MPRGKHYSPQIQRFLLCALYHEAQARRIPMTVLANRLLADALKASHGWNKAMAEGHTLEPRET
jgi:hypothetical protein